MFEFIRNLLFGKPISEEEQMKKFLIVGLGNIGDKYEHTRHNIGFSVLDTMIKDEETNFETVKLADRAVVKHKGRTFILIKPSTFMNLSGKAVKYWMTKEKIAPQNLLVITDDINLPFGTLRLKTKGSDGGHNGLHDVQDKLQTPNYNRLRFGVGNNFGKGRQVDYVLEQWNEEEQKQLPERLDKCVEIIKSFGLAGVTRTMNTYNGK